MKLRLFLIAVVLLLIGYEVGVRQPGRWGAAPGAGDPIAFPTAGGEAPLVSVSEGPDGGPASLAAGLIERAEVLSTRSIMRSPAAQAVASPQATAYLEAFERELNAARATYGSEDSEGRPVGAPLAVLRRSRWLDVAARAHAQDMAARGYFAHESPEGEKAEGRVRRLAAWAIVMDTRENLAFIETSHPLPVAARAREAMEGLMNSPGHRKNILNPQSTHVGLAVASALRNGLYEEYAVQVFGVEIGEWAGGPPLVGPVSNRPLNLTVRLDRRDVEFLLTNPSAPNQRYRDLVNANYEYRSSAPVKPNAAGNALVLPPLVAGRYTLNARLARGGPGYYEVAAFEIR